MSKRAVRRHHGDRTKQMVADEYGGYARGAPRQIGRLSHARKPCSCALCGNPRYWFGARSLQERRRDMAQLSRWRHGD
jgi:hypothetical protein